MDDGERAWLELWLLRLLVHADAGRRWMERRGELGDELLETIGLRGLSVTRLGRDKVLTRLASRLRTVEKAASREGEPLFANLERLAAAIGLSEGEKEVLGFAVAMKACEPLEEAFDVLKLSSARRIARVVGTVLGQDPEAIRAALGRSGILQQSGLLRLHWVDRFRRETCLELMDGLEDLLMREHEGPDELLEHFFRRSRPAALARADFPHVEADFDVLCRLLGAAARARTRGVNVLLHGGPGTGKTELARTLANVLEVPLFEVADEDEDGDALCSERRFTAYSLCQKLLAQKDGALVLFDEVEDVFRRRWTLFGAVPDAGPGKAWVNRLLEENPVPTVWISNAVDAIDPAFLRRFDYVLELRTPPPGVRRRILEAQTGELEVDRGWLRRKASDERLTPAHIERAVKVVRLVDPKSPDEARKVLDRVLEGALSVASGGNRPQTAPDEGPPYDPTVLNASQDLSRVLAGLERRPQGTVCLYGPPGTGKTAFVRHAAERLGRPLLVRRASDLLGPYLGETEAAIARMFQDARNDRAILFLDEADSFLQDRSRAHRNWEVSQVNELLVQMEQFEGLFVCATNLVDSLDPASLRRFALKIRFDPLLSEQRWRLFASTLQAMGGPPPEERLRGALDRLDRLTPGDFAAAARQGRMLDEAFDGPRLLAALEEEMRMKPGAGRRAIGFAD